MSCSAVPQFSNFPIHRFLSVRACVYDVGPREVEIAKFYLKLVTTRNGSACISGGSADPNAQLVECVETEREREREREQITHVLSVARGDDVALEACSESVSLSLSFGVLKIAKK